MEVAGEPGTLGAGSTRLAGMERGFRQRLQRWYRAYGRHDLPWRLTRDPYAVLVSEVMLQQTQVERVVPYYERWLGRWPNIRALAAASPADAIRAWGGLGYNRRALYLHQAATAVVERYGGEVPTNPALLAELPGVGTYTAAAVACFAGDRCEVVLDTNVARVVARSVLGAAGHREVERRTVYEAAERLLPARNARGYNLALMDLGALTCRARRPACEACPLRTGCAWRAAGYPEPPSRDGRAVTPFAATSRFARGRIVEVLRKGEALSEAAIAAHLPECHRGACRRYLDALEREGMVERRGGRWQLPGSAGRGAVADDGGQSPGGKRSIASPKL